MKVSIIIPSLKDNISYLKLCIESIKKYQTVDYEIIVVTNNSPAFHVPIEEIKVYHNEPQGQCQAVNLGVRVANNDYVLILDDDMVVPPNLEELFEKGKDRDFLCGHLMEQGHVGSSFLPNDCGKTPKEFDWEKYEKDSQEMAQDITEKGFGFPMLVKKEIWQKVEGYDESYDPWGSNVDSDLEYKFLLANIDLQRYKKVLPYHFQCVSGTFDKPEAQPYWQKNRDYFIQKWGFDRPGAPQIWDLDFKIPFNQLKYKPEWAKLENNPNISYE